MSRLRRPWSPIAALVAAWMLVAQSAAGAAAQSAGPVLLDAFGNVLCIASDDSAPTGRGTPVHDSLPVCCLHGCVFAGGAHAVPPSAIWTPAAAPGVKLAPAPLESLLLDRRPDPSPGTPRAPPQPA